MGAEYNKWSRRVTATHNVMLAYTRGLLGPMDYTPGGFRNVAPADFQIRNDLPFVQTTRAQGLAMYVVFLSPLMAVADSPDAYAASPAGFEFIRAVPTSWDETRFVAGTIGESVVVARRKGRSWYLGAMNTEAPRALSVPLDFLGRGRFDATLWTDGDKPDAVAKSARVVTAGDRIELQMAGLGRRGDGVHAEIAANADLTPAARSRPPSESSSASSACTSRGSIGRLNR